MYQLILAVAVIELSHIIELLQLLHSKHATLHPERLQNMLLNILCVRLTADSLNYLPQQAIAIIRIAEEFTGLT